MLIGLESEGYARMKDALPRKGQGDFADAMITQTTTANMKDVKINGRLEISVGSTVPLYHYALWKDVRTKHTTKRKFVPSTGERIGYNARWKDVRRECIYKVSVKSTTQLMSLKFVT